MGLYRVNVREIKVHTVIVEVDDFGCNFTGPKLALDTVRTESIADCVPTRYEVGSFAKVQPGEEVGPYNFSALRRHPIIR